MPRPTQSTGRPGTPVMPANWADAPSVAVSQALNSTVTIGPAGSGSAWNEGDGQMQTATAAAVYTGAASIMAVSDTARVLLAVEDPTSTRVYDVMLPRDAAGADLVLGDHVITVTAAADAALQTKTLTVTAVERGTSRFSRVLLAVLND